MVVVGWWWGKKEVFGGCASEKKRRGQECECASGKRGRPSGCGVLFRASTRGFVQVRDFGSKVRGGVAEGETLICGVWMGVCVQGKKRAEEQERRRGVPLKGECGTGDRARALGKSGVGSAGGRGERKECSACGKEGGVGAPGSAKERRKKQEKIGGWKGGTMGKEEG